MEKYKWRVNIKADDEVVEYKVTVNKEISLADMTKDVICYMKFLGYKNIKIASINSRRLFLGVF